MQTVPAVLTARVAARSTGGAMVGSLSVRTDADTGCFPVGRVPVSIAALAVAVCVCVSLALTVADVAFRGMCVIFVVAFVRAACSLV